MGDSKALIPIKETASTVWFNFTTAARLLGSWIQIMKWWDTKGSSKQKLVCQKISNVTV